MRTDASTDAPVLGLVPGGDDLTVTEERDGWVKVSVEEGEGFVSTDYVSLSTEFVKAESKAEEEARLAKEEAERKAAEEAAAAAARKASQQQSSAPAASSAPARSYAPPSGGNGAAVASYVSVCWKPICIWWNQPDKRSRLFRIRNERICSIWCITSSFLQCNERRRI